MSDSVDGFARLQRMRAQGQLSADEYEARKAELRGSSAPRPTSSAERWQAGWRGAGSLRQVLKWSFVATAVALLLIGVFFFGKASSLTPASSGASPSTTSPGGSPHETADDSSAESSSWSVTAQQDPMTDLRTTAARTRLSGVQADAEIAISCRSDGEINFVASTFQKDDQPAEMRTETVNGFGAQGIRYQMRADDKAAVQLVQAPLEYTNEVKLTSGTIQDTPGDGILPDTADEMAAAKRITLRLFLPNGEETFAWDQSSTEVGSVLAPCVASRAALRERKTEEQHAAEDQQRQAAERERQQRIEANKRDGRPNDDNTYAM